jgi:hypothetical protein
MVQLSYEPAFDPFHAIFRVIRLADLIERVGPLHRDVMRILDFYLLFPFRIGEIRLKQPHRSYRKLASVYARKKPYGDQPDARTIFERIEPIQLAALHTLASKGVLDTQRLDLGEVVVTGEGPSEEVLGRARKANDQESDLIEFLGVLASEYELSGEQGLKSRTGLLEYRYDAI